MQRSHILCVEFKGRAWQARCLLFPRISKSLTGAILIMLIASAAHAQTFDADTSQAVAPKADALSRAEIMGLYFTPPADVAAAVTSVIDQSTTEILVQAYGFTHNGIAQALVRAHERGVRVRVLLDQKSEATNRFVVDIFLNNKIDMRFDGSHAIAHNKVMVVDDTIVITGSFNFTNSAQTRNAENLLILRSTELAFNYKTNWLQHWRHSRE